MPKRFLFLFAIIIIQATTLYAQKKEIAKNIAAVLKFQREKDSEITDSDCTLLTTSLINALHKIKKIELMSREEMSKILDEQDFQRSEKCSDTECAVDLGKIIGVEKIIVGNVGKMGNTYVLYLQMINVETSKITETVEERFRGEKDEFLDRMYVLAYKITGSPTPTPAANQPAQTAQTSSYNDTAPPSGFAPAAPSDNAAASSSKIPAADRPKIKITSSPAEPITIAQSRKGFKINFEGEGPRGIAGYDWSLDGKTVKQSAVGEITLGSADSVYPNLQPGTYTFSARSRDYQQPNPNVSEWATCKIQILSNQKPSVIITEPSQNASVSNESFTVKWQGSDPDDNNIAASYIALGDPNNAQKAQGNSHTFTNLPTGGQIIWIQVEDDGNPPMKSDWASLNVKSVTNQPPTCKVISIIPPDPSIDEDVEIKLSGIDPEGESLRYQYKLKPTDNWADASGDSFKITTISSGLLRMQASSLDTKGGRSEIINIEFPVSERPQTGKTESIDINGVKLEMVYIRGGSFQMGSPSGEQYRESDEGPVHTVKLSDFWIGKYEVTQAQWRAIMGSNPSYFKGDDLPVESVSWNDCDKFIKELNSKTGKNFSLPSEAQWEYACRAGSTTRFWFDDSDSGLGDYAWYGSNSGRKTHPVGEKYKNAWGLYDMHGNVYEWCEDWYHDSYSSAPTNGSAWISPAGSVRVLRGGCWNYDARYCRSADRFRFAPSFSCSYLGFRVVRSK